ncbi:hypothetical protein B5X24_HaOG211711 [Helicoverpa armigera]|nr:hypothetical protein B5X24_HaOG211711 [Helicoverpa armigera]
MTISIRTVVGHNRDDNTSTSIADQNFEDIVDGESLIWYAVTVFVVLVISTITFIYGLVSWKVIRKFRNIKNYVYLSAVLVNILRLLVTFVYFIMLNFNPDFYMEHLPFVLCFLYSFLYLTLAYNHWLLIMCYIFYVDVVKVFQKEIRRKYLKSCLFGWVLPCIMLLVITLLVAHFISGGSDSLALLRLSMWLLHTCTYVPMIFNLVIFIKVLWALFFIKDSSGSVVTKKEMCIERCRRLSTAWAMFVLTNTVLLTYLIWEFFNFSLMSGVIAVILQIVALAIFVPVVKSNRELWREYFQNRSSRTLS